MREPEGRLIAAKVCPCLPLACTSQGMYAPLGSMMRSTVRPGSGSSATFLKRITGGVSSPAVSELPASPGPAPPKLLVSSCERSRYIVGSEKSSVPDSSSQGQVSSSEPTQNLPSPWPWTLTSRERRLMPSHRAEHGVQSCHDVNWQSMAGVQPTPALHFLCSVESPTAGTPQSLASTLTLRMRQVSPPSHVAEQGSQSSHSSHWPLTHTFSWQVWKLHASISSLSLASHGLQPGFGAWMMCRSRERWPPPHFWLQWLHMPHWPHLQSTHSHASISHGLASFRATLQPRPPSQGRLW
mmetsp:Transcript_26196/g.66775  ORF Transcript_26196/g.66775 Transcript_26196/m.66775 type:complete len:297 (+) Transcript_26196:1322-2212(+)